MDAEKTGAYLAMLRKTRGWTQQEIADRLGVSNKTISKWESGGGFPDITVLPALAELYGVTADDILAGETLTDKRRESLNGPVTAQKRRLLTRLRMRFDICFVLSLALAGVAWMGIQYVSIPALILSPALLWIGYLLLDAPLRDELPEKRRGLALGLWRKLAAATLFQWAVLLRFTPLHIYIGVDFVFFYRWKPILFLCGALALWGLFQLGLRRAAGRDARLIPATVAPWLIWSVLSYILWHTSITIYAQYGGPLETKMAIAPPQLREEAAQIYGARLRPYRLFKQGALAVCGLSGLILGALELRKRFQKKSASCAECRIVIDFPRIK